jgi:23S rRNA pseudouridine1911/1915/1917 synthase
MTTPTVLFSNEDLVAIDKPPGISVHDAPGPGGSLLRELKTQLACTELHPVHRLDKDASGVLLFAKNKDAVRALERVWSEKTDPEKRVVKVYWALCHGVPQTKEGVIDAPILEHQTGKPERLERALNYFKKNNPDTYLPPIPPPKTSAVHPAGRESRTLYKVLEASKDQKFSWLEVRPEQGRMHQIRVHLAHLSHPLISDALYGKSEPHLLTRMALHARGLEIPNPAYLLSKPGVKSRFVFESSMPADMQALVAVFNKNS